jgi:light-regulated signal transduction histidine kinase (bacteriophytochrome)
VLSAYLRTLQEGSGLDLVLVWYAGQVIVQAGEAPPGEVGAGLGLSVVKVMVEAHDGEVGVADDDSGSSTFWLLCRGWGEQ